MKAKIITLQGTDFAVSLPAEEMLLRHLKDVQTATRFRPGSYRENVEALRDVLLEEGGKNISKAKMAAAIALVGLPDRKVLRDTVKARFPRTHSVVVKTLRPLRRLRGTIAGHWWKSIAVVIAIVAILMSASNIFSALISVQPTETSSGWTVTETSIGPVRSYNEAHAGLAASGWLVGWQGYALQAVIFLVIALLVLRLRNTGRLPYVLALFACVLFIGATGTAQNQITNTQIQQKSYWSAGVTPLMPHMAYLQQCGDEIQYVFDGGTDGMLFRQLRDEGFQLAIAIPTRESDGTIDTKTLCQQYDVLRRDHSKSDIVLQYYAKNDDGTIRPYEFSDLGEGISSYGLFVK